MHAIYQIHVDYEQTNDSEKIETLDPQWYEWLEFAELENINGSILR